jgi:type I restriction enzyme, S subunit
MIGFNFDDIIGYFPTDWSLEQLKDSGEFVSGSTPSTTNVNYWGGDITWLVPSDLTALSDSINYIFESESKITVDGFNSCSTNMLPIGSLCLSSRATIGEAVIAGVELCTNQGFINLIPDEKHYALFLLYWVKKNKNYISRYAAGTTFLEIGRRTFKNLKIALPKELTEQKAIAGILSKVDEAIEAVGNSIKAAEHLKKSLIQNLLTGKLKPDGTWLNEDEFYTDEKFGRYPKEWSFSRFKDFAVLQRGKDLTDIDVIEGPYPVVKSNGIQIHHNSYFVEPPGVVTGRSGTIGKAFYITEKFWAHNTALYVKEFKGNCEKYIYYLILRMDFRQYYAGTTVPTLNRNDIHRLKISIPKTYEEQEEIVNKIDEYESVLQKKHHKIQSLRALKKSLMQNLLTGKVRVDVDRINKLLKEM